MAGSRSASRKYRGVVSKVTILESWVNAINVSYYRVEMTEARGRMGPMGGEINLMKKITASATG